MRSTKLLICILFVRMRTRIIIVNKERNEVNLLKYRDGNKSPETRFNKVYTQSSKTEQASEITKTLALYCRTIQIAMTHCSYVLLFNTEKYFVHDTIIF